MYHFHIHSVLKGSSEICCSHTETPTGQTRCQLRYQGLNSETLDLKLDPLQEKGQNTLSTKCKTWALNMVSRHQVLRNPQKARMGNRKEGEGKNKTSLATLFQAASFPMRTNTAWLVDPTYDTGTWGIFVE